MNILVFREGWTAPQHRLFNKTMKVLHTHRLAMLAQKGVVNETIFCRLAVDKTAKRIRQVLASVLWDSKVTQWLHNTLCDNLPREYLAGTFARLKFCVSVIYCFYPPLAYFDVLQTLKAKIPALIDKMVAGRICHEKYASVAKEGLRILLKRKWDPAASALVEQKLVRKNSASCF